MAAVQAKKAASPKVLYLEDEKEEAARNRKLGMVSTCLVIFLYKYFKFLELNLTWLFYDKTEANCMCSFKH